MYSDQYRLCQMTQRYVLYPGPVTCSKSGQSHYVSASTLARLHGVEMRDCIVFDPDPRNRMEDYADCIHLHPQYDEERGQPQVAAFRTTPSLDASTRTG
jgi:hypothetical protein